MVACICSLFCFFLLWNIVCMHSFLFFFFFIILLGVELLGHRAAINFLRNGAFRNRERS